MVDDGTGAANAHRVPAPEAIEPKEGPPADPVPAPPGSNADLLAKIRTIEQRQRWMLAGLAVMALVSVVWPLVALMVVPAWDRSPAPPPMTPAPAALPPVPSSPATPPWLQESPRRSNGSERPDVARQGGTSAPSAPVVPTRTTGASDGR